MNEPLHKSEQSLAPTLKWRIIGFWRSVWWPVKHRFTRAYEPSDRCKQIQREAARASAAGDMTFDEMSSFMGGKTPTRFRDPPLGSAEVRKSPLL